MLLHPRNLALLTALAAAMGLAGAAQSAFGGTTTVYSDNFTATSGTPLNGQTVQTSSGTAGGTSNAAWVANTGASETGSNSVTIPAATDSFLPFTPQSGYVYTLQATLNTAANTVGDWTALGFTSGDAVTGQWHTVGNTAVSWSLERVGGGGQPTFFPGPNATGGENYGTAADSGLQTVVITLDTTGASWTSSAVIQGDPTNPAATITYATNPTINFVGFGTDLAAGSTVSAFSLTASSSTVPEPATLAIAGVGVAGILIRRRRARA